VMRRWSQGLVLLAAVGCFVFAYFWKGLADPDPLKLAVGTRLGSEALVFALDQGPAVPPSQLRVVEMVGATALARALENGVVDAAILSLDEAVQMNAAGHPVRLAMILEVSLGADVVLGTARVKRLEDLKGMRVGVEIRSSGHYLLSRALEKGGLKLGDVELVPLVPREAPMALTSGQVDALVATEPDVSPLEKEAYPRLFDSSELKSPLMRVLAVREGAWESHREVLGLLAKRFVSAQPDMTAGNAKFGSFLERRTGLDTAMVGRCLRHCRFPSVEEMVDWMSGGKLQAVMEEKAGFMVETGLMDGDGVSLPDWEVSILR
jgi:NitT/TauT family transport system substrate-binding protein